VGIIKLLTKHLAPSKRKQLSLRWKEEGAAYAKALNDYMRRGQAEGWDKVERLQIEDHRSKLADDVYQLLKQANQAKEFKQFRKNFPPAYDPFDAYHKNSTVSFTSLLFIDNERLAVGTANSIDGARTWLISGERICQIPQTNVFGISPDRAYIAKLKPQAMTLHKSWDAPPVVTLPWPANGVSFEGSIPLKSYPHTVSLIPFPDGKRVLLAGTDGIFVITSDSAQLLHPCAEKLREEFTHWRSQSPEANLVLDVPMGHAALSKDGRYIAVGSQDSTHLILDGKTYKPLADIGNIMDYPHLACFSDDGTQAAFNSCHFYSGCTIGVLLTKIRDLKTPAFELKAPLVELQAESRAYAAVSTGNLYIIGDALGHLWAFDTSGRHHWRWFLGSTIQSLALSPDGKQLAVASHSGTLHILELNADAIDPYSIGTGGHRELRRWIFWEYPNTPLLW
jgi:WD40 repeat protein